MPSYLLYRFRPGHFARSNEIEADDDVEAVRQARWLVVGDRAEVWCGERKVTTFNDPEERS